MKLRTLVLPALVASLALACSSTPPPKELVQARADFMNAKQAKGANLAAPDLHEAAVALDAAEKQYADDADSNATRDLSYVASRKAIAARAQAGTLSALETKKMAEKDLSKFKDQDAQKAKSELEGTKQALTNAQREADEQRRKAEEALQKIAGMEAKQSDKGFVLTLSGSVLFATGKSVLLPQAQQRLGEVVKALKEDKRHITVVGHTDSQGADDMNMKLSQARADAVRNYLVQQGVESSRVGAQGMGETQPIADNETAEGRANNRRVEIVLENDGGHAPSSGGAGSMDQGPAKTPGTTR